MFDLTIALRSKSVREARIRAQGGPGHNPQISSHVPPPLPPSNMRYLMLLFKKKVSFGLFMSDPIRW